MQQQAISKNRTFESRHFPHISFGLSWLIVIPAGIWDLVTYFLPVFGGTLTQIERWATIPIALLLVALSLICHVAAHFWAARLAHSPRPGDVRILIFGDAAQGWPAASDGSEFLVALAGPFASLLLGALAYLVWNAQVNDFLGNIAVLVGGFNLWLFIINLIPAFPMDGGRLMRAELSGLTPSKSLLHRLLRLSGFIIAAILAGWSIFLLAQNARFSVDNAAITFLFVLLLLDGLWRQPVGDMGEPPPSHLKGGWKLLRIAAAGLLAVFLSLAALSLLFTNSGLDAPGVSLPIEPMIIVPSQYHHSHAGSFYLVTVISQAPITAGEWLLGHVDPAIQIVPPEIVTPKNTTPQEQAKQGYQMLDTSETTAIAVGLRLAGFPTAAIGKGAQVASILPASHANGILQVGDVITACNGSPVHTTDDLIALVKAQSPNTPVHLQVLRGQTEINVDIPLMPPASPTDTPKIGITIQDAGFDFKPPFPISIATQKIQGGPSAGLMFTLTLYNTLSANDLTHGWKIAGTGTINLDGTVGPIGGVKQKIFAAEGVGAAYFLCPVDNYADAVSVARSIKVIKIATVQDALDFLHSLPAQ